MLTHEYPVPSEWIHDLADAGVECWSFLPVSSFHCELNGHTAVTTEYPDGIYHYHATSTVPYLIGGFRGQIGSTGGGGYYTN